MSATLMSVDKSRGACAARPRREGRRCRKGTLPALRGEISRGRTAAVAVPHLRLPLSPIGDGR